MSRSLRSRISKNSLTGSLRLSLVFRASFSFSRWDVSYKLVALMRRPDPEMAEGVGMWSNLMQAMGFLSVFSNTAIICFTGGTLNGR